MPNAQAALERLSDPAHEVSAHYFLDQSGGAVQLVPEAQRAWHAGAGAWGGCTDVNSASIGIELCNAGDHMSIKRGVSIEQACRILIHTRCIGMVKCVGLA